MRLPANDRRRPATSKVRSPRRRPAANDKLKATAWMHAAVEYPTDALAACRASAVVRPLYDFHYLLTEANKRQRQRSALPRRRRPGARLRIPDVGAIIKC